MKPLTPSDPARIGPFRIVARLGAGGMGKVYLGRAESTGKAVAIKTIHGDLVTDREFRARFAREVAAARQVRGSYVAELVDADADAENPWLATAYAPGISVSDAVNRSGPLPVDAVRRLGLCVARAVADIHSVGLVHRDLKPDNVLLTSTGPKVIDFGIARGVAEEGLTRTGMVAGSPPYMAPEQLLTGDFGTGSDVFGLAAILHFAATGIGPYGKGGVNELYGRAITIGPVIDPALPESLAAVLRTCLTKEPAGRPTAAALLTLLEQAPGEDPGTGWLPSTVMAEILAQATEALSAESSGGAPAAPTYQQPPQQARPQPQPPQQQQPPRYQPPQAGPPQGVRPQSPAYPPPVQPQPVRPQSGPPQSGYPQPNRAQPAQQRHPSWPNNNVAGAPQQQNTPARPQYPQGVVNTPPSFAVPQQQNRPSVGPYAQPGQYGVVPGVPGYQRQKNPKAMWGMILGLASVLLFLLPVADLILAGLAIGFGLTGKGQANRTGGVGRGQALTGIILGTIFIVLAFWYNIAFFKDLGSNNNYGN